MIPSAKLTSAWLLTVSAFLTGPAIAAQSASLHEDNGVSRVQFLRSTSLPAHEREREKNVTENGLITVASEFSVAETINRLTTIVEAAGFTVFARIDHAANAAPVGMELRPTQLLMFGNPKGGTLLMQDQQTIGLDLPLRVLAWEDASGHVWISYDDPVWIANRHGLGSRSDATVTAMATGLTALVSKAAVAR